jgi:subtilisin family serine protease
MRDLDAKRRSPAVFEDEKTGLVRMVYKEIALRFAPRTSKKVREKILGRHGFQARSRNAWMGDQYIAVHESGGCVGQQLLEIANDWAEMDEIVFAVPNFVSEFRREALPKIHEDQWHLHNRGLYVGQKTGEDVEIRKAWRITKGRGSVVVAVLDDGVDIEHPNLKRRIKTNPDPTDPRDKFGRDFFVPDDTGDHYDPRPKRFKHPYQLMAGNDIHGTPCAGVIASSGKVSDIIGAAPGCKILPVKVFHADDIAPDARVADAMRYAAANADVISCSWGGSYSPDIELAIEDAGAGRSGRGVPVFCAAGNDGVASVDFPAALDEAIAVGASTDQAKLAPYSNRGKEISVVAPSSGGILDITTTDVSYTNRGFNAGDVDTGGNDGLHTNEFGGTSSATPLTAGVAALMLSANSRLTRDEVRKLLEDTADKIGPASSYNASGHSRRFGHGRVNAAKAVRAAAALKPKSKKKTTKRKKT